MPQSISMAQLATQLKKDAVAPLYALIGEEDLLQFRGIGEFAAIHQGAAWVERWI